MLIKIDEAYQVAELKELEAIYGEPSINSIKKETSYIHPHYKALIEASPFLVLATNGPDGLDVSPRGDQAGFVHVYDDQTLLLPDRRGNNRIDSLRNIIHDSRVALMFLIPGVGETLRVSGEATITTDPEIMERFSVNGVPPRSVLVIKVKQAFFQCAKSIIRSQLWSECRHVERGLLPSPGLILEALTQSEINGAAYDAELPERMQKTLY